MPRFYTQNKLIVGEEIALEKDICRHIAVLRLNPNEKIILFNGDGSDYFSAINFKNKQQITANILEKIDNITESSLNIHLLQSISTFQKIEWIIQKAVELGVTTIQPMITERTQLKITPTKISQKLTRWQEIVIAACEQSGRAIIPKIEPIISFSESLALTPNNANKFIFHTKQAQSLKKIATHPQNPFYLCFGPEGGFSNLELALATTFNFKPISLGTRILRTETAPIAAISALQFQYGDF